MHWLMMSLCENESHSLEQCLFQTVGMAYHSSKADRFSVLLVWTLRALHWDNCKKRKVPCNTPPGSLLFELFGSAVPLAHYQMVPGPGGEVCALWPRRGDNRGHACISRLSCQPLQQQCMPCASVVCEAHPLPLINQTPASFDYCESSTETKPYLASTMSTLSQRWVNEAFMSR